MSVLRGERKPGKKFTGKDRAFALALTVYEADLCQGCGKPMSLTGHAQGEHAKQSYSIDTITCIGCEELEMNRESSKEPVKGEKVFLIRDE